jgi:hypothetical protein
MLHLKLTLANQSCMEKKVQNSLQKLMFGVLLWYVQRFLLGNDHLQVNEGLHFLPKSYTTTIDHHYQMIVQATFVFASLVVGNYLQRNDQTFPQFVGTSCLQKQ